MAASFFFYDLETSGFNPREARIMQFAGQQTDLDLNPIGEPIDLLIKLSGDVLPDPDAILVTKITPQQTIADGLTEAEFLKYFYKEVVRPNTIFLGFNTIRFDDEFMRFLHYRNFYDAYEWHWCDDCSRWDLLDVVRMTRALRPEGIKWPFAPEGSPSNRLELLTAVNGLDHSNAHNALNDVGATIALARLIREHQKDLFDYLLGMRDKKKVRNLVLQNQPFVYSSGRYPKEHFHTTVATLLAAHPEQDSALVYDLRHDPTPFLDLSVDELVEAWKWKKDSTEIRLPVKTLKYNRCPAVAPLGVMKDEATQERLQLSLDTVKKHLETLRKHKQVFAEKVLAAVTLMDSQRAKDQASLVDNELTVDSRLYDGFLDKHDQNLQRVVRGAEPGELSSLDVKFNDDRFNSLLPLYKARNYPQALTGEERATWDKFVEQKLLSGGQNSRLAKYFARLQELSGEKLTNEQQYLLEELKFYGESVVPVETAA